MTARDDATKARQARPTGTASHLDQTWRSPPTGDTHMRQQPRCAHSIRCCSSMPADSKPVTSAPEQALVGQGSTAVGVQLEQAHMWLLPPPARHVALTVWQVVCPALRAASGDDRRHLWRLLANAHQPADPAPRAVVVQRAIRSAQAQIWLTLYGFAACPGVWPGSGWEGWAPTTPSSRGPHRASPSQSPCPPGVRAWAWWLRCLARCPTPDGQYWPAENALAVGHPLAASLRCGSVGVWGW